MRFSEQGHFIRNESRLSFQYKLVEGRKKIRQMWKRIFFQLLMPGYPRPKGETVGFPHGVRKSPGFCRRENSRDSAWGIKEISPRLQLHWFQKIFTIPHSIQVKTQSVLKRASKWSSKVMISILGLLPTSFAMLARPNTLCLNVFCVLGRRPASRDC